MKGEKQKIRNQEKSEAIPKKIRTVKIHLFYLSLIFLCFLIIIGSFIYFMPGLHVESKKTLKNLIPQSFKDLQNLRNTEKIKILYESLNQYREENGLVLLLLLSLLYICYQSFPLFLWWMTGTASIITILIGSLYDYFFSIFYCSLLSTVSPLVAYVIFKHLGKPLIEHFFQKSLIKFQAKIKKHAKSKMDLFIYLAILRLTPIFPNALINILTASLSLPVVPFFFATYFGLLPNTVILVSIGQAISKFSSVNMQHQVYIPIILIVCLLSFQRVIKYKFNEDIDS